jgi:hypothetical protein
MGKVVCGLVRGMGAGRLGPGEIVDVEGACFGSRCPVGSVIMAVCCCFRLVHIWMSDLRDDMLVPPCYVSTW